MRKHRGAAEILEMQARNNRAPVSVTIQVTDRCNYDCVHCYQEHVGDDELTTAEVESVFDQLAAEGVLFITLMGGEYFMRPDADHLLQAAHDRGFAIKLLTTGHHIHDKRANFLATIRPLQVDLSLYGSSARLHEQVTNQPGSWKRTCDAARRLIARDIEVQLKAPMMESNADHVESLIALAEEMGASYAFDPKVTAIENGDQSSVRLRMSGGTLHRFYREGMAAELAEAYKGFDPHSEPTRPEFATPCRAGQQVCSIHPTGDVWPCNALPLAVGNIRKQTFREIWHGSAQLEDVRTLSWAKISECNRCAVREYCARCHGMALVEQGEIRGPSLEACRHAVATRDALREAGMIPETETQLPPTWARVDSDGQHSRLSSSTRGKRSSALRVLS